MKRFKSANYNCINIKYLYIFIKYRGKPWLAHFYKYVLTKKSNLTQIKFSKDWESTFRQQSAYSSLVPSWKKAFHSA